MNANAEPGDWLTIAEAAQRLGMTERALRRILARPENADKYAARTRQETRTTRTGTRRAAVLSPELFAELQAQVRWEHAGKKAKPNAAGERGANADRNAAEHGAESAFSMTVAAAYELALRGKDDVIAQQNARIDNLEADKARLYVLLEQAQANLHREQTLRLLTAPAEASAETSPDRMNEPQGRPEASGAEQGEAQVTVAQNDARIPRTRGWWRRWWKR